MADNPLYAADGGYSAGPPGLTGVGASIGKALFGDPAARAKLLEAQARVGAYQANAQESTAHAGLYTSQQGGQDGENTANAGLPQMFSSLYAQPAPQQVAPSVQAQPSAPDPGDGSVPITVNGQDPNTAETFRNHLPGFMAAMVQGGHAKEAASVLGALAAFNGSDGTARRGMIANNVTPGKDFATTDARADEIAQNADAAKLKQDTSVATINHASDNSVAAINHASDIPVANIHAGAEIKVGQGNNSTAEVIAGMRTPAGGKIKATDPKTYGMIDAELNRQLGMTYKTQGNEQVVDSPGMSISPQAKTMALNMAISAYQRNGGNPVDAVHSTIQTMTGQGAAKRAAATPAAPSTVNTTGGASDRGSNYQPGHVLYNADHTQSTTLGANGKWSTPVKVGQ